jgi:lipopolysaccharide/colanic/teichoic acid biosynthesis glycosyltransferase
MYSDFLGSFIKDFRYDTIYNLNIISLLWNRHSEIELIAKRAMDIIGALIAISLFAPFMIIGLIGIFCSDGRPLFYSYYVIGYKRKLIKVRKIRTMVKNAEQMKHKLENQNEMNGPVFKIHNDPRILKFGKWLRKYSVDETPQLFSVLKGDLSLVGPRAPSPYEFERFDSWQRRKASIKPGLTCLWQINGRAKVIEFDTWVKMDLEYIDNWSLLLDIEILLKTIPAVLSGRGAS